jgi:hypothetical protein
MASLLGTWALVFRLSRPVNDPSPPLGRGQGEGGRAL